MPEKRKKVLYIITKSGMGGAGRSVFELASSLDERFFEVAVAAGGAGELFERLSTHDIRTMSLPALERDISTVKEIRSFFALLSLIRRERPDVVHLHSPKAGGLGGLAARIAGVARIVYTAHGWAFFEDLPWWNTLLRKLFSYMTVLLTHTTIAVSKKDAHAFDGWPFMRGKIIHIPNGVAVKSDFTYDAARAALEMRGIPLSGTVFGTIAELHKNKGLFYLIEAATEVPNAMFVIIGDGEERKRLKLAIAAHRLENRVHLAGYIPDAAALISAFDVFLLPSVKEGLPYVLLEAGAAGLPTVASAVGGIPDIIEHEQTGLLVEPEDPLALAEALKRLIADEPFSAQLGAALKQKIQQDFSLDLMVQKTHSLY